VSACRASIICAAGTSRRAAAGGWDTQLGRQVSVSNRRRRASAAGYARIAAALVLT
jgi:hypothetical protein